MRSAREVFDYAAKNMVWKIFFFNLTSKQKRDPAMWDKYQTSIVDFIRNTLELGEKFSSDQVTFQM